jgi:arylsulfatase A-like enzyme
MPGVNSVSPRLFPSPQGGGRVGPRSIMKKQTSRSSAFWGVAALAALAIGCQWNEVPTVPPNILVISIDTLRADHLGAYGYGPNTSPVIDQLASRSTVFEEAYAPTSWTLPSHVGMLTGVHPADAGIVSDSSRIPEEITTIAEPLRLRGYLTAAFVDSNPQGFVGAERGFSRGFDHYDHAPFDETQAYRYDMAYTVRQAVRWLESRPENRPFFLFLHTKSVHTTPPRRPSDPHFALPYDKPAPYLSRFLPGGQPEFSWGVETETRNGIEELRGVAYIRAINQQIAESGGEWPDGFTTEKIDELIALYDAGIFYVDEQVGRLLNALKRLDLNTNTVILLTSDHGEAFLDHRMLLHAELYRPLVHVPLIVFDPVRPDAVRVSQRVSLLDVAPTVWRMAGVEMLPENLEGSALIPGLDKTRTEPRPMFSYYGFQDDHFYDARAVQIGRWKLISQRLGDRPYFSELFDILKDPGEEHPIASEPSVRESMEELLQNWFEDRPRELESIRMSDETLRVLRSLGYVR